MAEGMMVDLREAGVVEVSAGPNGEVWVNVDGECRLRVRRHRELRIDGTRSPSLARECFLNLVAEARDWEADTDLNSHNVPVTHLTLTARDSYWDELATALGVRVPMGQSVKDAIDCAARDPGTEPSYSPALCLSRIAFWQGMLDKAEAKG